MADTTHDPFDALAAGATLVSRGGELETRLAGIAASALAASGAAVVAVYLLDGEREVLVPGGIAPGSELDEAALSSVPLAGAAADGPLAGTIRVRRATVEPLSQAIFAALGPAAAGLARAALVPMTTEDQAGTQQIQGLLVAGLGEALRASSDDASVLRRLTPFADLAASAIHLARLEQSLLERSEWLERIAHVDALTGLSNRRAFERALEHELARAQRQATPLSLAMFDVDGLAEIDRTHGAEVADDVLRRVAATLADSVRLVDTVARYGGDEFVVLAPGTAGRTIAERVMAAIGGLDRVDDAPPVSMSVGVVRFPEDGATGEELLLAAIDALGGAKRAGRGSIADGSPRSA